MTKQEALQKIEELKQFVVGLESKEKELSHGNLVLFSHDHTKRIIIDTRQIKEEHLNYRYLVFDKHGVLANFFNDPLDSGAVYTKIRNVFDGK